VAVGTGGAGPQLAALLRDRLQSHFGPELGILVAELKQARRIVRERVPDRAVRREILATLCAECSIKLIASRGRDAWRDWFERVLRHRLETGPRDTET
ncbi:MAG: siroheme synthase, partial [Planctomycetes bacterium]|nr:siroheme synthase [Planctomycetota bacterium]